MSDDKYTSDEKMSGDLKVNLSAGENEIRYYDCDGDNCIFEILENKLVQKKVQNVKEKKDMNRIFIQSKFKKVSL